MTPSVQDVKIIAPLIIALPMMMATIVIHGIAVVAIVHFVRYQRVHGRAGIGFWRDVTIIATATMLALLAHLIEIAI